MRQRGLTALVVLVVLALMATGASAFDDDPGNNTTSIYTGQKSDPAVPGCDTLDPVTTQNALVVGYKCINNAVSGAQGLLDLTSFTFTAAAGTITLQWTTRGAIPTQIDPVAGITGYSFQVYFKNANRQNSRQIIGDTLDCTRYAHMGPYLTGNNEYLMIYTGALLEETGFVIDQGWAHNDPMTNSNWAFLPDNASIPASHCEGTTRVPHSFAGTNMNTTISGNTITTKLPYTFRWVDNQTNELAYELVRSGDLITSITPISGGNVDGATTPSFSVHTNPPCVDTEGTFPVVGDPTPPCSGEPDLVQSKQGVSFTTILDWLPWAGFDLGIVPNPSGISEIPSALCPGYHALEYQPGGGKNNTGGTYAPLGKGPTGQDRDTQANPFFGLSNYDSSGAPGSTSNDLVTQGHGGTNTCTSPVPAVSRFTGSSPATVTAG